MKIWDIPPGSKVLVATTTGRTATRLLRTYDFDFLVFHQSQVLDGRAQRLDEVSERTIRSRTSHLHTIPPGYSRSVLSRAYLDAMRAVSQGTKVAFEMMLYALERRHVSPGETVYAVAGTRAGWDTIVKLRVPELHAFHAGGFADFEISGTVNREAEGRLREALAGRNRYAPTILLYHPKAYPERDYAWPPFSLLAVASVVDRDEHYVYVIDNNLLCRGDHSAELAAIAYKLRLVGASCMIGNQIADMLRFLDEVRRVRPDVPVVCGGPLPTILGQMTLDHPTIDFIVRSQGEITFLELLAHLDDPRSWDGILGLGFKRDGAARINKLRPIQRKQDLPPYPFDVLDLGSYVRPAGVIGQRVLSYISSQGCPFKCAFCSDMLIYQNKWTARTPTQVTDDLRFYKEAFGVDGVKFYDSNLLVSDSRVRAFCQQMASSGLGLNYATSIHPHVLATLGPESLRLLRDSGCRRLLIGTESGSDEELVLVRKEATVAEMLECAVRLRDLGIVGTFTLIIGLPGTNVEKLRMSVDLGRRISEIWPEHEVKMQVYQPYPGTELYDRFKVPGAYEPQTLAEWSRQAFNTTPTAHRDISDYIKKIRLRHPHLFEEADEMTA
jgi:radical SAM superfamily enzyme YgiQ (UPF0313 family)